MLVIGVTGLRGSGKSLAARAARSLGIPVLEMRKPVVALMRKKGIKVTNRSLRLFADEIRRKHGKAVSARLATAEIQKLGGSVVLVNGVRSSAEIDEFKKNFEFKLIAVTAPVRVRFGRILKRRRRDDPRKYSDFLWSERMERHWGLAKAIASADYVVKNGGTRAGCEKELQLVLKRLLA